MGGTDSGGVRQGRSRHRLKAVAAGRNRRAAGERFRHPGEETIRETLKLHPGADQALVRAYFNFRPEGM